MKTHPPLPLTDTTSVWAKTVERPGRPKLDSDQRADVCIVGAGIAGLTTAYLLAGSGLRVVIVDDGPLGGGMTEVTSAHLSDAIDDRFTEIEKWHGEKGSQLAAQSHSAAINQIEHIVHDRAIDCDFTRLDGYLFRAPEHDQDVLDDELAAARRAGLQARMVDQTPLDYNTGPAIRFPNQARFHPLKYLVGVAKAIEEMGGQIFENSHVDYVEGGDHAKVQVGPHLVCTKAIVIATNSPINDLVAIHTKQAPYMTYVIGARIPKGSVTDALYWDTLRAYHYVRIQPMRDSNGLEQGEYDLLIVGGEDHKSGQATDTTQRHARLEAWAQERFPIEEVEFTWAGQVMETVDGLAFIGRNPMDKENVYVVTGDSGMGLTHGTIAGMLLSDLIQGKENPWASLYDPSRKPVRAALQFAKENLNVAAQYAAWVTPGEVHSKDDIQCGSGAVLRRGLSKVAIYKDDKGVCHEFSAVCPHLSCIVEWNAAEHSWDCPCHGSRFDKCGHILNGPANSDLPRVEE